MSRAIISREDFEAWIKPDLDRIELCVAEALATVGLDHSQIDKVFLTGGTSFVTAVRRIEEQSRADLLLEARRLMGEG